MDAVRHQRGYEAFTVAHDGTQSMTDGFALVTLTGGAPAPVR